MDLNVLIRNLNLKRARTRGDEIQCSCPYTEYHLKGTDKTPSFCLNVSKGVFFCFSCGSKGLIEELVAKTRNVSLDRAIELLEDWGFDRITIELARESKKQEVEEILPEGLLSFFDKIKDAPVEMFEGELDDKPVTVYPVRNMRGNLVGAIARSKEDRWHKVLWHMNKKKYLYGEHLVQREKPLLVVEGPGDAIAMKKAGIDNVVALMGITVSKEQVDKLLSLSSDFVIWLDKDEAGKKGWMTLFKRLDNRARVRYVNPWQALEPNEKDPRDVFEKRGAKVVQDIVYTAKSYLEHITEK